MSQKKHLHVLSELSAHPIARNIEWSELIPALSSIGMVNDESNGNYAFTRNGYTLMIERSHDKAVSMEAVLKLRRFLRISSQPEASDPQLQRSVIVAVDHHNATVVHNPEEENQIIESLHADLTKGRLLHKSKHSPSFKDTNPIDDVAYFEAIIKSMMKSERIVVLSHGTGSSSAAQKLLTIIDKDYPKLTHKIIAIANCDLEAMTEPQIIRLGAELLHGAMPAIEES